MKIRASNRGKALFLGVASIAVALSCTAHAAGPFDGTYTGHAALVRGNNGSVCKSFLTSLTVTDGHLTYVLGANYAVINTDVAADGSFNGSGTVRSYRPPALETLTGKVTGSTIEADASNPHCAYHLSLHKAS